MLTIKKGGNLIKRIRIKNEEEAKEVTEDSPYYLQENCNLDNDVTLKDVFLLIQKNIDIYKIIINNHVEEFISEAFTDEEEYNVTPYDKNAIEYLELYKCINWNDNSSITHALFRGVGYELKEDVDFYKKGQRITWSIEFEPVNKYINYPFRLCQKIYLEDFPYSDLDVLNNEYDENAFTLFDILYWPIWELSFYGPPEKRDYQKRILERVAKTIPKK